jgi:hypothetical protein
MLLATALRDLSIASSLGAWDDDFNYLARANEYAEKVLELVVEAEGDIRPQYLEGYSAEKNLGLISRVVDVPNDSRGIDPYEMDGYVGD